MEANQIEKMAIEEFRDGVSAGAAARQICRSLGASGMAPTLKRMLEEILAEANLRSHDRECILNAFKNASPEEEKKARQKSFARLNRRAA